MAVHKAGKHELSSGVNHLRAHAAHFLNGGIVTHGGDFCSLNGDGLRPRLLRILRVNASVNHDDVCRLDDGALRIPGARNAKKDCKDRKCGASETCFHRSKIPFRDESLKMWAAC